MADELRESVCPSCDGIGKMVNITGEHIIVCETGKGRAKSR
jgi:hypothetical protein